MFRLKLKGTVGRRRKGVGERRKGGSGEREGERRDRGRKIGRDTVKLCE